MHPDCARMVELITKAADEIDCEKSLFCEPFHETSERLDSCGKPYIHGSISGVYEMQPDADNYLWLFVSKEVKARFVAALRKQGLKPKCGTLNEGKWYDIDIYFRDILGKKAGSR